MARKTQCLLILLFLLTKSNVWAAQIDSVGSLPASLFGYQEINLKESGSCQSTSFNHCHLKQWQAFLKSIKSLPVRQQIKQVNKYANEKKYTLDIENYGVIDYWATPKEFLNNNGDCEDYAIIKMLSMKWLGYDTQRMRVVVVQDTNLRIPHAVMAIENNNDIFILDNQIEEVLSHAAIFHYVPVYSVNENSWWMHVPN